MTTETTEAMDTTLREALAAIELERGTLAEGAVRADRDAAFPKDNIEALRRRRLMGAGIPAAHGGLGLDVPALAEIALRLGELCGSTAMIWAMHQIQVHALLRAAETQPLVAEALRAAAAGQRLIASVTSEEGIGGNLRESRAALEPLGGGYEFTKRATTVSYGTEADAYLVTLRRDAAAAPGDQVLVLARADQVRLRATGEWNTLGMRGTRSAPLELRGLVDAGQVLDEPFGSLATRSMVPVSHVLWAAAWTGVAAGAYRRAVHCSRARARTALRAGTFVPNPRLGRMHAALRALVDGVRAFAGDHARWEGAGEFDGDLTARANALKITASEESVGVAVLALEVCGMAGYSEDGEFSVARHLRDLYSGRLMISNDKLNAVNSEVLLFGDDVLA
ncbi:acyl-CoA dehydrogenase family protein [Streptomyces sp. NPDC046860]|uniref:acyl-CoA dehydrogenase family protein n=1 Tax=Streptomyces sp. NPDC046860 TaxID=3154495 RepID=UPI0033FE6CCC